MKVLNIVEAMGGGVFTFITELCNHLCNDCEIYVAYGVRKQTPNNFKEKFDKRVHLIEVKNFTREISIKKDFKSFYEIREIIKSISPDVIHLHSSKAGVLGRWVNNGKNIPIVYTPHGYSFLMNNRSKIKTTIFFLIEKISGMRNCLTVACSNGEYRESLRVTKKSIYINNGINIDEINKNLNNKKKNNHSVFTIYTLGRINYQKNPQLFNDIAKRESSIKFMWIGDGELRSLLDAKNIEIKGWCDRDKALNIANECDAFLLPSLWEGLPISLLESMYLKKVCVVSNIGGNNDVITNMKNGYVCDTLDDYIKAIDNIQSNSQKDIVQNAYDDIVQNYNINNMADKYRNLYKSLIEDKHSIISHKRLSLENSDISQGE